MFIIGIRSLFDIDQGLIDSAQYRQSLLGESGLENQEELSKRAEARDYSEPLKDDLYEKILLN